MSEFDAKARDWDKNILYIERSEAVAKAILQMVPVQESMTAMEYGSGTALLSFALQHSFAEITLMDNSREMTAVTKEKISGQEVQNMKPLFFDLEKESYDGSFDMIYNQMVMHHVQDISAMLARFHGLLNPGGYIAIADLYAEDGSFHGPGFDGHLGFDVDMLAGKLAECGFSNIEHKPCYTIRKSDDNGNVTEFPIFLLVASR